MPGYVDGFLLPLPKKNLDTYRRMARKVGKIWMEHGALGYTECVGDDVPPGKLTSFPLSVKLKKTETVVFSWASYRSRKHRDQVMKKVMADPRMQALMSKGSMPFDGQRMVWGGFKKIVEL